MRIGREFKNYGRLGRMKKFASVLMGNYDTEKDRALFKSEKMETHIRTVRSIEEAKDLLVTLRKQGFGVVEFCGAFTDENLEEFKDIVGDEMGLARVVAASEEKSMIDGFFKA